MSNKRKIVMPTAEEDAAITAAALSDPDALPLTDTQLRQLKPLRPRGRPAGSGTKIQVTMRIDEDVLEAFKTGGDGWQTRMNGALREWLQTHR
ncbi:BrnA antitoxin family protein [Collimonas silvisoli]|uniref:BrnA antitoxin family protein n=1 Tax=Collimonas silvisoli TaxID=2825884 RepID=UPI001B8D5EE1|nr:BrnA antitoxin family protein [Collimonas silvisoli]